MKMRETFLISKINCWMHTLEALNVYNFQQTRTFRFIQLVKYEIIVIRLIYNLIHIFWSERPISRSNFPFTLIHFPLNEFWSFVEWYLLEYDIVIRMHYECQFYSHSSKHVIVDKIWKMCTNFARKHVN